MKVLVIGDVIIDRYTRGKKRGVSAETPTVVAEFEKEEVFVGGAGLVARNLLRLGAEVVLCTTADVQLRDVIANSTDCPTTEELYRLSVNTYSMVNWTVTEKRRYYVDDYKMVQYDVLNKGTYVHHGEAFFLQNFERSLGGIGDVPKVDAVVVCDNRHGVLTQNIAEKIISMCKELEIPVYVDSQVSQNSSNHLWYTGADWILLNMGEATSLMHYAFPKPMMAHDYSRLCTLLRSGIVVKMGASGAMAYTFDGKYRISPGVKVNAVDTCGAGDAFLAAFVNFKNDLDAANRWAAISTTKVGTVVPSLAEMEYK